MPATILALLAAVLFGFSQVAIAQITQLSDGTAPPVHGVGHNYEEMLNETVNPATGMLTIHIAPPVATGRKLTVPLAFEYNSGQAWFFARRTTYSSNCSQGTGPCLHPAGYAVNSSALSNFTWGGWSATFPEMTSTSYQQWPYSPNGFGTTKPCTIYTAFMFKDATGSSHQLNLTHLNPSSPGACSSGLVPSVSEADTASDTYYKANLPFAINQNGGAFSSVAGPDGSVYFFNQGTSFNSTFFALPTSIEDRNGNVVHVGTPNGVTTVTDTMGRAEITISSFGRTATTSANVAGQPYTLNWQTVTPTSLAITVNSHNAPNASACGAPPNSVAAWDPLSNGLSVNVVKTLTLPNGKQYTFGYDSRTGFVNKITYPSGGYVSYAWNKNPNSAGIGFNDQSGNQDACAYTYDTPAVTQKSVSFDGTTIALQQTFTYQTNNWTFNISCCNVVGQWATKTTTVVTQDFIAGTTSKIVYTYGWVVSPPPNSYQADNGNGILNQLAMESTIQHYGYAPSYPLLKTETKNWDTRSGSPAVLACSLETLDNGLVSGKYFSYGTDGQITDVKEYDYGQIASANTCASSIIAPSSPPPIRETSTTYQSFPSTPIFTSGPSIFNLPASVQTYDGSTGTLSLAAETDTSYDQVAVSSVSALPAGTHDETNYGAASAAPRGNATTLTRKCIGCSDAITTYAFDETGQVLSKTDACGNSSCADMIGTNHTASYSYANSYTVLSGGQNTGYTPAGNVNAYVTSITDALGHASSYSYDFNNGQLTIATDPNTKSDNYIYNDLFFRPTQMSYPDGGQTSLTYHDSPYSQANNTPNVQKTELIVSGSNVARTSAMDGVVHLTRILLTSDPVGTDTGDLTYDGMGRMRTKSNQHRSSSSATDGTATYSYDALGRTTSILEQDGSTLSTSYSGNCTTVTDEALNSRKSCVDALGRLTQVFEDPAHLNYETDYQYDALGNLLNVNQKGNDPNAANWRTRIFTYDTLSRLLTANNPESGTVTYTYDNDGNLSSKKDAANVTTSYTYDVLNRLTGKTYSNGDHNVTYTYDAFVNNTTCGGSGNFGIGRRTGMTDGSGSTTWTYDTMGRIWSEQRTIGAISKTISTCYNLDGSVQQITYPSGSIVAYSYDTAGQLTQIQDTAHQITYFQSASYFPAGQLNQATYGSIVETMIFNNRQQPCWFYATTATALAANTLCSGTASPANVLDLKYDFHAGTGDNGNLWGVTNDRDSNRSVAYSYDALNRIASAITPNTDCTTLPSGITTNWGESFTIDPWGNLTNRTVTKCSAEPLSVVASNKNRLNGFGYNLSGGMNSNGGVTYSYDAEQRLKSTAGVTYTYDGDGERVKKSNGTLYWGTGPLLESDLSGNLLREFIFAGGKRIARRDLPSGNVYYIFSDNLDSAHIVTTSTGAIQNDSDYYPYGGERVYSVATPNQNYKFNGKERDQESGLDNFGARYDSSSLGRFMTPDWAAKPTAVPYAKFGDPQTLNLYAYVENQPLNRIDADGHCGFNLNEKCKETNEQAIAAGDSAANAQAQQQQQPAQNQETPQSLTDQIPGDVRATLAGMIQDSNSPTADDKLGGFHEEYAVAGLNSSGGWVVSRDQPGPYANPDTANHVSPSGKPANQEVANSIVDPRVVAHVHPAGVTAAGNQWKQPPSPADRAAAVSGQINIVFGARDHKVYFYNSAGDIGKPMKLKDFLGQ